MVFELTSYIELYLSKAVTRILCYIPYNSSIGRDLPRTAPPPEGAFPAKVKITVQVNLYFCQGRAGLFLLYYYDQAINVLKNPIIKRPKMKV